MSPSKPRLLVVRREAQEKSASSPQLDPDDFEVDTVQSGDEALARLDDYPADLILVGLELVDMDATAFIDALNERETNAIVVTMGGVSEKAALIESTRHGASFYVTLPSPAPLLGYELQRALAHCNLRVEAEHLRRQIRERIAGGLGALIGTSGPMQRVYQTVHRAASSRAPWLISGEKGVGKRTLARMVHARSRRASQPLIWFRTTGDDDEGASERLFGEDGCFAAAEGGTLVIESVSELLPSLQLGLLHALEHKTLERHSHTATPVDVRIVATTRRDPRRDVHAGRFREDLYDRLSTVSVEMPPLRERSTDVLLLAEHFLRRFAEDNHRLVTDFSRLARAKLAGHNWPGNVRSLEQVIESAVMRCDASTLDAADLGFEANDGAPDDLKIPGSTMADIERHAILQTLDSVAGSTARAAEILDVSVRTIQYRLHEYGVTPKRKESRPPRP